MISLGPMKDSLSRSKGDSMISLAPFVQRLDARKGAFKKKRVSMQGRGYSGMEMDGRGEYIGRWRVSCGRVKKG